MNRKNRFDTFKEAPQRGPFDEFPMLELGIDPQLHLSRNDVPQPFFLICEQDTLVAQMAGSARLEFRDSAVNYFDLELGDFVYVPGGAPHRLIPAGTSINLRYKAEFPGLEAVAWYAPRTRAELARFTWDCADELPQEAYLRACVAFNADPALRTCAVTGDVLPPVDLTAFRWAEVAAEVRAAEAAERERGDRPLAGRRAAREIAPATDARVPLKRNVYECARDATATLTPLFPYTSPGSIVPCIALQDPGTRGSMGFFTHFNTVREVNVSFGARDSYQIPGGCAVGPYQHGVGQKAGQANPKLINIPVITQRQSVDGVQHEKMGFVCAGCGEELFVRAYDAYAFPDLLEGDVTPAVIGLPTISQSDATAEAFNDDPALRTCRSCGMVNEPFPRDYWGWNEYRRRVHVIAQMRGLMRTAAGV